MEVKQTPVTKKAYALTVSGKSNKKLMYRISTIETIVLIALTMVLAVMLLIIPEYFSADEYTILIFNVVTIVLYAMILWNISKIVREFKKVSKNILWIIRLELVLALLAMLMAIGIQNAGQLYFLFGFIRFVFYIVLIFNVLKTNAKAHSIIELRPFIYALLATAIIRGTLHMLDEYGVFNISAGWHYLLESIPYAYLLRYFIVLKKVTYR